LNGIAVLETKKKAARALIAVGSLPKILIDRHWTPAGTDAGVGVEEEYGPAFPRHKSLLAGAEPPQTIMELSSMYAKESIQASKSQHLRTDQSGRNPCSSDQLDNVGDGKAIDSDKGRAGGESCLILTSAKSSVGVISCRVENRTFSPK